MNTRTAFASVALLALACGDSGVNDPSITPPCSANVTVTVGAGTTPDISWSPRCLAGEIIVDPGTDFALDWAIATNDSSNRIQPAVRYGTAPSGTFTIGGPAALAPGNGYRVRVFRATADSSAPFALIGSAAFAP